MIALTVPLLSLNPNPNRTGPPSQVRTAVAPKASSESVAVMAPNRAKRGRQCASATPVEPKTVNSSIASAIPPTWEACLSMSDPVRSIRTKSSPATTPAAITVSRTPQPLLCSKPIAASPD